MESTVFYVDHTLVCLFQSVVVIKPDAILVFRMPFWYLLNAGVRTLVKHTR